MKNKPLNKMRHFSSEVDLVESLTTFFVSQGFQVLHEVPNMGQSIDLVAHAGAQLFCIEAKMKNWKQAIMQCKAHRQVADFICIALGSTSISPHLLSETDHLGYGIIHCAPETGVCTWVRRPEKNHNIWKPQRNQFESNIKEIAHA